MTDEFDDDALRDALIARSGGPVEPLAGRQAVVARAGRIRTRRTVALGGAATAVIVAGLALIPLERDDAETPSDVMLPAATVDTDNTAFPSSTTESERPTTTDAADTTATDDPDADSSDGDPDENIGDTDADGAPAEPAPTLPVGGVTSTVPPNPESTPSTVVPESTAPATSAAPPTTQAPTTVPTTSDAPGDTPFTRQYSSAGGSITIRWDGSALSLQAVDPVAGFDAEIEDQSASRIRVRFRSDDEDSRVDVRARDGKVSVDVS